MLYWYEMRLRPVSIGTQPRGFIQVDHDKGRHGIVAYDREISDADLEYYDMIKWEEDRP